MYMDTLQLERRSTQDAGGEPEPTEASGIVQAGILFQASLGSISAVEYLKANDIDGAVIRRVLGEGRMRADDRAALDERQARLEALPAVTRAS